MIEKFDICIVGLGPAGLGAALEFSRVTHPPSVICLESGLLPSQRFCTILQGKGCRHVSPCQIIGGVGGCSLLSGGKISDFPAGRALSSVLGGEEAARAALRNSLASISAFLPLTPPDVAHINLQDVVDSYAIKGFDFRYYDAYRYRREDLVVAYEKMLDRIEDSGISIRLGADVVNIRKENAEFDVEYRVDGELRHIHARNLVVAVGRLGRSLLRAMNKDFSLTGQRIAFDVGVRLEFPLSLWPDLGRNHNDLKLHFGAARTFCVCAGGTLAPYRWGDIFLLEGFSDPSYPTDFTNLGLTLRYHPNQELTADDLLDHFRQYLIAESKGLPIRQPLEEFLALCTADHESISASSIRFWRWGDARLCFPEKIRSDVVSSVSVFVSEHFERDAFRSVTVFAPEIDYFWDRYPVSEGFESVVPGLFLVGDAAGYFRGILQAFCSGELCAQSMIGE